VLLFFLKALREFYFIKIKEMQMVVQIEPWIDNNELDELKRVVNSTFVVEHELTSEFESMTKELTGSKHAIAITNGTMALYCSLVAIGVGSGDEVIVPNITFVATANAVILSGAIPVLCEIKKDTFTIDIDKAHKLITTKTKAIIPVHLYGQSANMNEIISFAEIYSLKVLEDAAQGVGVKFNGKHVGTFGDIGILSYYGNKTITCGEGGMVLTDDDELAKKVYRLKNHGRDIKGTFVHEHIGFNFAFTEMQAAIGIAQMKKLPAIIKKKRSIHDLYEEELSGLDRFKIAYLDNCTTVPVFWFTSFLSEDADDIMEYLLTYNIQTRKFFYPLHLQPCYSDKKHVKNIGDDFSISEEVHAKGISLPSSYNLTLEDQRTIINKIKCFYENRG
jgi:perosamine synthetase